MVCPFFNFLKKKEDSVLKKNLAILLSLFLISSLSAIKIVFEGVPESGKSTLIKFFEEKGFKTIPEAATLVIENALKKGKKHPVLADPEKFQADIIDMQIKLEKDIKEEEEIAFLDRVPISSFGYAKHRKHPLPPESEIKARKHIKKSEYDIIFLPEPLPYKEDEIRKEKPEEIKEIFDTMWETCLDFGFRPENNDLFILPKFSAKTKEEEIKWRAYFIVEIIYKNFGIAIDTSNW
ncbi:AAA family ATPase [Candidatus Dependentiae bacterium]|nr:AAA family ATPase [Candidatus Dependentiae bacterium]